MANPPLSQATREELREVNGTVQAIMRDSALAGGELTTRNARRIAELQDKASQLYDRLDQQLADESRAARASAQRLPQPGGGKPSDSPFSRGERSYLATALYAKLGDSQAQELIAAHDEYRRNVLAPEYRAVTSSGAGGFVPTVYAGLDYEPFPYNSAAPLWNHLGPEALPESGLTVEVPRFTSAASVLAQSAEGSAVADSSPTVTNVTVNVRTMAGGITVNRQVLERATPLFDSITFDALRSAYAAQVEYDLCSGTATNGLVGVATLGTSAGVSVVSIGTADVANGPAFVNKMAQGIVDLTTSDYSTDAVFVMHPRRFEWLKSRSDGDGRPYVSPVAGRTGALDPAAYGQNVGELLGIPVITTAGMATTFGTNQDRIVLLGRRALRAWAASPEPQRLAVDVDAGESLQVRLSLYNYVAASVVRPSGVVVFSGDGLTNPFA